MELRLTRDGREFGRIIGSTLPVYSDYLVGKFKLVDLIDSRRAVRTIGVAAATGKRFRNDGSYS